jgi:dephospho-CoA kinase
MDAPALEPNKQVHSTKPIIGLVGGIGAGKSLAARLFAERGAQVIDADSLGHAALRQPDIRKQVQARWGAGVMESDGQVSRRKLGAIVFADPNERAALQGMVFPWIDCHIREEIAQADAHPAVRLIVLDAAIMQETGWDRACCQVVYIDASREQRLARLAENRGWNAQELIAREKAQMDTDQKRSRADQVLMNDGSPADLARQIDCWFEANSTLFA